MTRIALRQGLDPLAAALGRVDLWTVSLVGFLVRGGLVLLLVPIWPVPSPLDVADALGPAVTRAALGGPNPDLVRVAAVAAIAATVLVIGAFAIGAVTDAVAAEASAEELGAAGRESAGGPALPDPLSQAIVARAFAVRLAALVPFGVAVAATVPAVVDATYRELIDPTDLATPLVVRVLAEVPGAVVVLLLTWLVGEAIGGLAVRLVVLDARSAGAALAGSLGLVARRPVRALATLVAGTLVFVALLGPALLATALAWRSVVFALRSDGDLPAAVAGTLALAALWLGALILAGFAAAVRAVLWTTVAIRR